MSLKSYSQILRNTLLDLCRPDKLLKPKQVPPSHLRLVPQKDWKYFSATSNETHEYRRHGNDSEHTSGQNRIFVCPICRKAACTCESSLKNHLIQGQSFSKSPLSLNTA
ncbi:hypothetical protein M422DRAFT_785234 [Sphaerobolus stellatus SS14]|uniref:Unplaced genomic scaffold SPHSTscaffold_293, whole genome shotgun sequence n=1 Tax=Sphaerobolus stellatus (strain SS14) TaxID=990650 RepID=A0A0C9UMJ1_SPHS4|nr:hypothetical protein M422DRAFT_785234 [Sphaerobolus stellatus SS14]